MANLLVEKTFLLFSLGILMQVCKDHALNLRPKELKVELLKQCPTHEKTPIVIDHFDVRQPERQKYALNSTFRILEDINSNLYFKMNITRCSLSQSKCDRLDTIASPNVCKNFNKDFTLWSPIVSRIEPTLRCPFKAGKYHVENSTFDLSLLARTPIVPGKILVNLTLMDYFMESNGERAKRNLEQQPALQLTVLYSQPNICQLRLKVVIASIYAWCRDIFGTQHTPNVFLATSTMLTLNCGVECPEFYLN